MAAVLHFKQLRCWQKAFELNKLLFLTTKEMRIFSLKDQFEKASLSIMNNIAEGFGRRFFEKEFIRFLDISQGSSCEVRSMTYVLEDMEYLTLDQITPIRIKSEQVGLKVLALINHLRSRKR